MRQDTGRRERLPPCLRGEGDAAFEYVQETIGSPPPARGGPRAGGCEPSSSRPPVLGHLVSRVGNPKTS